MSLKKIAMRIGGVVVTAKGDDTKNDPVRLMFSKPKKFAYEGLNFTPSGPKPGPMYGPVFTVNTPLTSSAHIEVYVLYNAQGGHDFHVYLVIDKKRKVWSFISEGRDINKSMIRAVKKIIALTKNVSAKSIREAYDNAIDEEHGDVENVMFYNSLNNAKSKTVDAYLSIGGNSPTSFRFKVKSADSEAFVKAITALANKYGTKGAIITDDLV